MEPRILEKESFEVIGLEIKTSLANGQFKEEVKGLLADAISTLALAQIPIPNRIHPPEMLGISSNLQEDGSYTYMLGAEVTTGTEAPEGTVLRKIPSAKYAVFCVEGEMPGASALLEKQGYIQNKWLPNSAYSAVKAPSFELYCEKTWEMGNPLIEFYLPIVES